MTKHDGGSGKQAAGTGFWQLRAGAGSEEARRKNRAIERVVLSILSLLERERGGLLRMCTIYVKEKYRLNYHNAIQSCQPPVVFLLLPNPCS